MSPAEYEKEMSELHNRVVGSLEGAVEELNSLDPGDYYGMLDMKLVFEETSEVFKSAYREALAMNTPPEVEELHEDLLLFYSYGEEITAGVAGAAGFFRAVLPLLKDVQNLALPNIPEDSEVTRIKGAYEEDGATMHGYVRNLKAMKPPEKLQPYEDNLVGLFHSMEEDVVGVGRAVTPEDKGALIQFQREFPAILQRTRVLQGEIMVYLFFYSRRIENLLRKGNELAGRIESI